MAEFVSNPVQLVQAGQNVLLDASIPCNKGYVVHRAGAGIVTLRGIVNNACACFALSGHVQSQYCRARRWHRWPHRSGIGN